MKILVGIYSRFASWNIPDEQVERLRREFPHHAFHHARTEMEVESEVGDADVAFMSELRPSHFEVARRLRWIHSPAAGVGSMIFPALVGSPVLLSNSRGISADPIAEHVIAMTLALFRKFPLAFRSQAARYWAQDDAVAPPPLRLVQGTRVLIVGLGSIGAACAWRFAALGAEVTAIRRRTDRPVPAGVQQMAPVERMQQLLPHADVVVISAAQTGATRGLIGRTELSLMNKDAILINVSRGKLVDEEALVDALRQGALGGAGLDVFEHEPLSADSPLWTLDNVIITPHMAGFRADHWEAVTTLFAENLKRFERGEPLQNLVDKTAGY